MYATVIFDVDGTLIDTEQAILLALQRVLSESCQKQYACEELHFALGIPGMAALEKLAIRNKEQALAKWDDYMNDYFHTITVFTGIEAVLSELGARHIPTGIVTSKTKAELTKDFIPFGLMKYLSFIVCADDTAKHKPHPEPLLKYLELSGARPETALYIGDTAYDQRCAGQAGIDFGLALWGSKTPDLPATHIFQKPHEILTLL